MPLIPGVSDRVLPLVDSMYLREPSLLQLGMSTFLADQMFIAAICDSDEEVSEQKQWEIFIAKHQLTRSTYEAQRFNEDIRKRYEQADRSGRPWEAKPTRYLQKYHQLRHQSEYELERLQNEFNAEVQSRWDKEVLLFTGTEHLAYEPDGMQARGGLVEALMERQCACFGFQFSPKLTSQSVIVYAKPLVEPWMAFLAIARAPLGQPISSPGALHGSEYRARRSGPDLVMGFGVVDSKTKKPISADNDRVLMLRFEWFFPIRKAPLWSDYSRFYNLAELEALIAIHMALYGALASRFEQAVLDGLRAASAK